MTACHTKRQGKFQFHKNPVIAHRGAWKNTGHPQNSIASLRATIALNCHGSELDVHLTADDSLVVYHDLTHHGMVIDSTRYSDLIKIPLKNGEKIPTLHEYLSEGMKQAQTKLIIDIKTPKYTPRALENAKAILAKVKEMKAEPWVEFLVGDLDALDMLLANTTLPVAYLGRWKNELKEMYPEEILKRRVKYLDYQDVHYKEHPDWIDVFKKNGIHLNAWTVNKEEDMMWFIEQNFDYITTDEPEKLLDIWNQSDKNKQ
ncbi:MAG: hypothetical protein LBQ60_10050 [Bacteroidales bacterium]|jgi:glycerophosphoryl diester phosphodiesterase|nr:hypothetical protein [Bacteroidales bacterium]